MKGKACLSYLISVCNKVTHLVDERQAVDVIFLNFSQSILLDR